MFHYLFYSKHVYFDKKISYFLVILFINSIIDAYIIKKLSNMVYKIHISHFNTYRYNMEWIILWKYHSQKLGKMWNANVNISDLEQDIPKI